MVEVGMSQPVSIQTGFKQWVERYSHIANRRQVPEGERHETIVDRSAQGWSQRAFAKEFGLSRNAVVNVLKRGRP